MNISWRFFRSWMVVFAVLLAGCDAPPSTEKGGPLASSIAETATRRSSASLQHEPPPGFAPAPVLSRALSVDRVEVPTEALGVWQRYRKAGPTLVYFSADPALEIIPAPLRERGKKTVADGDVRVLSSACSPNSLDPAWLPTMAVSAALESQLFTEIVWVMPSTPNAEQVSLDVFRQQLLSLGAVSASEAQSFSQDAEGFSGVVRGIPFRAVFANTLPALASPVVLHYDLSFFAPLYKSEIKTPLFPLLYDLLQRVRATGWDTLAVSVSASNLTGSVAVDVRFVARALQQFFAQPELLDRPLPELWGHQQNILTLREVLQADKVLETALAMEKLAPADADVNFALYQGYRGMRDGTRALEYLAKAVKADGGYAVEYVNLAAWATEQNLPDQAERMLRLALEPLQGNPFVRIDLIRVLRAGNKLREADHEKRQLLAQPWSQVYFAQLKKELN